MKTSSKLLWLGITSLVMATGFYITPASAELFKVGSTKPETGNFPEWYEDSNGLRLNLCLAGSIDRVAPPNYCLTEPPISTSPSSVDEVNPGESNFPDEAFWWTAEAAVINPAGANPGRAILVLATEAAFANGEALDGDQIVFNRTRIRIQGLGLRNGIKYRITYPYGVKILTATQRDARKPAEINITEDFGCVVSALAECNFKDVLAPSGNRGRVLNPIGKPWLVWDPAVAPAAPIGYIGDPNVAHRVTGSPTGNNFFKVEELNSAGTPVRTIANTNLFSVSGKLSEQPSP